MNPKDERADERADGIGDGIGPMGARAPGATPDAHVPNPVMIRKSESESGEAVVGNLWREVGGRATFEKLVRAFYAGVATDTVLLPMYPEQPDLEGAIQRLTGFLEQYWGGPTTYSQERGHPRLRMRQMPFKVNLEARDHWLTHMRAALDCLQLSPLQDATIWGYLDRAAQAMVNTVEG
jgi:hemoglobin